MVIRGRVENGVVVFQENALPDGIDVAIVALPTQTTSNSEGSSGNSILDIPTYSVGGFLKPFTPDDDILGEMLEGRE